MHLLLTIVHFLNMTQTFVNIHHNFLLSDQEFYHHSLFVMQFVAQGSFLNELMKPLVKMCWNFVKKKNKKIVTFQIWSVLNFIFLPLCSKEVVQYFLTKPILTANWLFFTTISTVDLACLKALQLHFFLMTISFLGICSVLINTYSIERVNQALDEVEWIFLTSSHAVHSQRWGSCVYS